MEINRPAIIDQHNSWISIDSVQGCPSDCAYCYLKLYDLTKKVPKILGKPEDVYHQLANFRYFRKSIFHNVPQLNEPPIAIGNYTDICSTPQNRKYLLSLLRIHKQTFPTIPVCIPTKAVLNRDFLNEIQDINAQVIFCISLAFLPREFERGTHSIEARLNNFRLLSEYPNVKSIHWWRPVTSISLPDPSAIAYQIDLLMQAGSMTSAIIGLRYGERLAHEFTNPANPLYSYFKNHSNQYNHEIIEEDIKHEILRVANAKSYPVFFVTDCALSYVLERHCYNAEFRRLHSDRNCLSSNCSTNQKNRCRAFVQKFQIPSRALLDEVAGFLNLPSDLVDYSEELDAILVEHQLKQEEQNFLTQATSFPVIGRSLRTNIEFSEDWRILRSTSHYRKKA